MPRAMRARVVAEMRAPGGSRCRNEARDHLSCYRWGLRRSRLERRVVMSMASLLEQVALDLGNCHLRLSGVSCVARRRRSTGASEGRLKTHCDSREGTHSKPTMQIEMAGMRSGEIL